LDRPREGASVSGEFEKEYHEEAYLFEVVGPAFRATGRLDAHDFFFIVRWKANRAISKVADRLAAIGGPDLKAAVSRLAREVYSAKTPRERFDVLVGRWGLRLPMASAILTVLYPDDFTVYDVRACEEVDGFRFLADRRSIGDLWSGYLEFKAAVEKAAPAHLSLRDKDRFLFSRSRHRSLVRWIENRSRDA
jgi:hypothetical protein